jgi:hypothetical protein
MLMQAAIAHLDRPLPRDIPLGQLSLNAIANHSHLQLLRVDDEVPSPGKPTRVEGLLDSSNTPNASEAILEALGTSVTD